MRPNLVLSVSVLVALVVGGVAGYLIRQWLYYQAVGALEAMKKRLLAAAEKQAHDVVLTAREQAQKMRAKLEQESEERRASWRQDEKRLHKDEARLHQEADRVQQRREQLDQRFEGLEQRISQLNKRQSTLDKQRNELQQLEAQQRQELERVANLSLEEARDILLEQVAADVRQDMARVMREEVERAEEESEDEARKIITVAIQRLASEQVAEITTRNIEIPSDDLKGRIIGRGGRNIRLFEQKAGVDVIVDDTPEMITISSFNPIRREVAARAMHQLVADGRIHPARIETILGKAEQEVEKIIREEGERAVYEAEVPGLNKELRKLLGQLHFRTSYGQNQLLHSIEVAKLSSLLAAETGASEEIARAGGLLHDIGKAVDFEVEGTHAAIGADLARRYGVSDIVVNCIEAHHHEAEQLSLEAVLVEAADAISSARPGARRESLEHYIKRIRTLEEIAHSFRGVKTAYAIQAGREVRIIVRPDHVDDLAAIRLSRDIARKIEDSLQYPGKIKVTVIRETRAVGYAK
ncbi:MAG TPA: ribonuclease Y [Thermoflexia bacterium]|nr:ribonuclease Y [Thermoflexia bacterium]